MAQVWNILALLLVITALVWLVSLWHWQSAAQNPSASDLALQLVALPVVLTAALLLAVWGVANLRSYATAPLAPPQQAAAAQAAPSAAMADERHVPFRLLASSVQLRAGSDWASAQASMVAGECRPELDPQIKDDDGIAVFTAPVAELATDEVALALAEIVPRLATAQTDAWVGYEPPGELLRALALLRGVLASLQDALQAQWPALAALPSAARAQSAAPALAPNVSIRVGVPARWSQASQQVAREWITHLLDPLVAAGLQAAGQSRAMAQHAQPAVQVHVHPVASAEALWLLTEQQLSQWQRGNEAGALLVLTADSLLSETEITAMSVAQQLFSGKRQGGRVPGEGAAGLLLASPAWPLLPEAEPLARLHRASVARRDKSADAAGRVNGTTLLQAATDALQASGIEAAQIECVSSDADHRASRTLEVHETLQQLLPQLEPRDQLLRLGIGCGDVGLARLMACVALAASQTQASKRAALVLGTFPDFERFALVVAPPSLAADSTALASKPSA